MADYMAIGNLKSRITGKKKGKKEKLIQLFLLKYFLLQWKKHCMFSEKELLNSIPLRSHYFTEQLFKQKNGITLRPKQ